jgi:hypothetical protein
VTGIKTRPSPNAKPAATIVITHSGETTLRHLLADAVRGAGREQSLHILGERRLG